MTQLVKMQQPWQQSCTWYTHWKNKLWNFVFGVFQLKLTPKNLVLEEKLSNCYTKERFINIDETTSKTKLGSLSFFVHFNMYCTPKSVYPHFHVGPSLPDQREKMESEATRLKSNY